MKRGLEKMHERKRALKSVDIVKEIKKLWTVECRSKYVCLKILQIYLSIINWCDHKNNKSSLNYMILLKQF